MMDPILEKAMAYLTGEQEKAMAYLMGELGENERKAFEEELARSSDLRTALEGSRELLELMTAANEEGIVRLVNTMIQEAVRLRASDIHVIGERNGMIVYYRIDGQL